ncbi:hypothetical protein DQ384_05500 [Sphaerisporangium album]|uniref:Minor tail protein n=1 Tax=Sphaerisporangium album TaxID=509200 RepID=A0A367FNP2_9ACTN|nr:hypothetical protein [Sphaerisporangium album]RCG31998.1 hypothetical protein DQ384_05500 [Sphaerisporangium album]
MAVPYRYLICDLLTDREVADVEFDNVTYDHRINMPGVFTGKLELADLRLSKLWNRVMPRDTGDRSSGVGRHIIHVIRGDDLWGSYWLWYGKVSQQGGQAPVADVKGMSLDGFMQQVEIQADLSYIGLDQIEIARQLVGHMQSDPRADLGILLPAGDTGVLQDLIIAATDNARYGQKLQELANAQNGFQYRINTRIAGRARVRELVYGYPTLGKVNTRHDYSQPGNVLSWSEEVDATRGGTRWRAQGASTSNDLSLASGPLVSQVAEATEHLNDGWPRIDRTASYPDVRDLPTLNAFAQFWAATAPGVTRVYTTTVQLPDNPTLTPHDLGDTAALRLVNERYPEVDGVASFVRDWPVVGLEVRPPRRDNDVEEATLIYGGSNGG